MNENGDKPDKSAAKGNAPMIVIVAIAIVAALSAVQWEGCTNGKVKNYSLVSDLSNDSTDSDVSVESPEMEYGDEQLDYESAVASTATGGQTDENKVDTNGNVSTAIMPEVKPKRVGEMTVIEDYSPSQDGLSNIAAALAAGSTVRIAVVGDSYIEGDIMTQNLRADLQDAYGGMGVGFMNMHSDFPGFRRSVKQGGQGWKCFTAAKRGKQEYMALSEQYAIPQGTATATYKGSKQLPHAGSWSNSKFLFVSPKDAEVSTRVGEGEWVSHQVKGSSGVQCIEVDTLADEFAVKTSAPDLAALGVWLNGSGRGVSVDCMSSRGISGTSLTKIPVELCRQMSAWVDYDLIILEFGINVLSPKQKNYSRYGESMVNVINHLRQCYPKARFLLMGVGDRGEKRGGQVKSMITITDIIDAQRMAARSAGILFWDTRDAMGGDDSIVEWAKSGRANKDYIHLTHKGGEALAKSLSAALCKMIDQ